MVVGGDLKGETESEIIATQDLALQTIYHAIYIYIRNIKSYLMQPL